MSRAAGSHGPNTANAIRKASLRLNFEHGIEAMSLRELATMSGCNPPPAQAHPDQQEFTLIRDRMHTLLPGTDAMLALKDGAPLARLRAFITRHLLYRMERKRLRQS